MGWVRRVWGAVAERFEVVLLLLVLVGTALFVVHQFRAAPAPGADVLRPLACSNPVSKPAAACSSLGSAG